MPRVGKPSLGIGIAPAEGIEPPSDRLTAGRLAIRPRWNETPSCNRALILFCRIERADEAREGRRRRRPPSFSFGIGFQGTRPADAGSKFGRADPEPSLTRDGPGLRRVGAAVGPRERVPPKRRARTVVTVDGPVGSEGIEPSPHRLRAGCATATQRARRVGREGVEPSSLRLKAGCLAIGPASRSGSSRYEDVRESRLFYRSISICFAIPRGSQDGARASIRRARGPRFAFRRREESSRSALVGTGRSSKAGSSRRRPSRAPERREARASGATRGTAFGTGKGTEGEPGTGAGPTIGEPERRRPPREIPGGLEYVPRNVWKSA